MSIDVVHDMSIDVAHDMSIDVAHDMSIDVAHDMRVSKTPRIRAFFAMMRSEGIAAPQGDRTLALFESRHPVRRAIL